MSSSPTIFGCEIASGRLDREGYAFHGATRAHIAAWTRAHGAITGGLELDHLCRRRNCVALHHLELVDRAENERRKSWRYRASRARCARGHDLRRNRVVTPEQGIVCRQCNKDRRLEIGAPDPSSAPRDHDRSKR